jgi:hypothetical protein
VYTVHRRGKGTRQTRANSEPAHSTASILLATPNLNNICVPIADHSGDPQTGLAEGSAQPRGRRSGPPARGRRPHGQRGFRDVRPPCRSGSSGAVSGTRGEPTSEDRVRPPVC